MSLSVVDVEPRGTTLGYGVYKKARKALEAFPGPFNPEALGPAEFLGIAMRENETGVQDDNKEKKWMEKWMEAHGFGRKTGPGEGAS